MSRLRTPHSVVTDNKTNIQISATTHSAWARRQAGHRRLLGRWGGGPGTPCVMCTVYCVLCTVYCVLCPGTRCVWCTSPRMRSTSPTRSTPRTTACGWSGETRDTVTRDMWHVTRDSHANAKMLTRKVKLKIWILHSILIYYTKFYQ